MTISNTQILGNMDFIFIFCSFLVSLRVRPVYFSGQDTNAKTHLLRLKDVKGLSDLSFCIKLEVMGGYFCKGIFMCKSLHRFSSVVWEMTLCPVPCLCLSFTQAAVNVKHGCYHPFSDSVPFRRKQQPWQPTLQASVTHRAHSPCKSEEYLYSFAGPCKNTKLSTNLYRYDIACSF